MSLSSPDFYFNFHTEKKIKNFLVVGYISTLD